MRLRRKLVAAIGFALVAATWIGLSLTRNGEAYEPTPIAEVEMKCFEEREPVAWSYCVNAVPSSANPDVLYYLHARNGNATWWNDRDYHTGELYKAWAEKGQDPPTVVAVSFGKLWMLSDHGAQGDDGLYGVFLNHVIPTVEARLGRDVGERMVAGISMGGFNTLLVALKSKGVFARAASVCSPVPTVSQHDGLRRVIAAARETDTSFRRATLLWLFGHRYYPSREVWAANDPLTLSRSFSPEGGPSIYLTCGKADDWGCFVGSERLAENVRRAGGLIEWVPREGGHCDIDYPSLAEFLQADRM